MYHFSEDRSVRGQMLGLIEFLRISAEIEDEAVRPDASKQRRAIARARANAIRGIIADIENSSAIHMGQE